MYRTLWLWLLVIFVGIQFGAGWYETLAICPVVGRRIGRSGAGGHGEFGDAYAWTRRWRGSHSHRRPLSCRRASSGRVQIPLEVRVYRIVQCHSKLHVRQWRAKNSRPLVHPRREKVSLRSTLWCLSRCHQTKLSSVPVRVGALTDGISDTPSVSSGN